jgi:hypothetical protein
LTAKKPPGGGRDGGCVCAAAWRAMRRLKVKNKKHPYIKRGGFTNEKTFIF